MIINESLFFQTSYSSYTPQIKTEQPDNASAYGYSSYTPQVKAEPVDNSAQYGYDSYSSNTQSYTSYVPPSQPTQGTYRLFLVSVGNKKRPFSCILVSQKGTGLAKLNFPYSMLSISFYGPDRH